MKISLFDVEWGKPELLKKYWIIKNVSIFQYPTSMQNMETSQSHIVATAKKYLAVQIC